MKVTKVLLRWFKSFNTNYVGYPERLQQTASRPWNLLQVIDSGDHYFIEIPIERDNTTIIGANESGKSHLLDAISKVIVGKGIGDSRSDGSPFAQTDLCHFCNEQTKNIDVWPNIGLEFNATSDEFIAVLEAAGIEVHPSAEKIDQSATGTDTQDGTETPILNHSFTLILLSCDESKDEVARLYVHTSKGWDEYPLSNDNLENVRQLLPKVRFLKSDVALDNEIPLGALIRSYDPKSLEDDIYDHAKAQEIVKILANLTVPDNTSSVQQPADYLEEIKTARAAAQKAIVKSKEGMELARQLFKDVLQVSHSALKKLYKFQIENRSSADQIVSLWNQELEDKLKLSRFWQQDDAFTLYLNYKQGILHFEITDRTKAKYTFRERSSGLRYFLSYYIQAKALEVTGDNRNCIIMMDEPDSFLSLIGQRNMLAVFESLISADISQQNTQLIYTTHSPNLINRNFPRRLRLVRKGYADEGTQYIYNEKSIRRYEPARSAFNVEMSQSLFMGATNLVLEGPVDQFLIAECVRVFANPDNISNYLDQHSGQFHRSITP